MKIQKYFLLHNKKLKPWIKYWLYIKSKVKKIVNLFVLPEAGTSSNVTYSINEDGTINLIGRTPSSGQATFMIFKDLEETGIINGKAYTLSASKPLTSGVEIRCECFNGTSWQRHLLGGALTRTTQTKTGIANTTGTTRIRFMIYVAGGNSVDIENLLIKLELVDYDELNIFDGELELGNYSDDGNKIDVSNIYRNANFVDVLPETTYTIFKNEISQRYVVYYYNSNKEFISKTTSLTSGTFTTPANTYYINFRCFGADFVSDFENLDIQILRGV